MKPYFVIAAALLLLCPLNGMRAQNVALSTNAMDYADYGTVNLTASMGVSRHWSVSAGVKYNPFEFGTGESLRQNKQRSLSAGARFWPWHIYSGWWLSGVLRCQEYSRGGFSSPQTTEGQRFGGGAGGGYSYMLGPHFNVDIGVGVWGGYDVYTSYACQTCGKTVDEGDKYFVLPNDIILSLTYIF